MDDFILSLTNIDAVTAWVLATLVFSVAYFIKELVGSTQLAVLSVPILTMGGLLSHYALKDLTIRVQLDKDSNAVIETGIGVVTALILLIWTIWVIALLREYRAKARRVLKADPTK